MQNFDSSVFMRDIKSIEFDSALDLDQLTARMMDTLDSEASCGAGYIGTHDLGCGRLVLDYSIKLSIRYVMLDIVDLGKSETDAGSNHYRLDIKAGTKNDTWCDIVYCVLFLGGFWFLKSYFKYGNALFLAATVLVAVLAALVFTQTRQKKFGQGQGAMILKQIRQMIDSTGRIS